MRVKHAQQIKSQAFRMEQPLVRYARFYIHALSRRPLACIIGLLRYLKRH